MAQGRRRNGGLAPQFPQPHSDLFSVGSCVLLNLNCLPPPSLCLPLSATRSRSSSCPLSSPPWCLSPPQGQRRRGRRLLLRLRLRLHPTTHQLQCQCRLPPPPQRRARRLARRKLQSPLTFAQRQCEQRQPTAQVIASWQSPTGGSGLLTMPRPSMVMSPTSPRPVVSGTIKSRPAGELHRAAWTLLTCRGGGHG
jgi:hypothetical protein